jgi:hypothetical protein
MSSRYLDMVRGQRRRASGFQFTAKAMLGILALVAMVGSAIYWWGVQSQLTDNRLVALGFTALLVLASPSLVSFLIPWSPAGMLLQKVNARTWGHVVVIGCSCFLFYYSYQLQYSWWAAQPVVAESNLIVNQVLVGIIGFIIIPALLWTPVTSEELVEQVKQAHLVKRYELQTQADIAILRATLLRAQEKALIGFANLTIDEREELAGVMRSLVSGIDRTLKEVGESVSRVSGAMMPFEALADNGDVQEILDYIGESLTRTSLSAGDEDDRSVELVPSYLPPNASDAVRRDAIAHEQRLARVDADLAHVPAGYIPSGRDETRSSSPIPDDRGSPQIAGDQSLRSALTSAGAYLGPAPMDDETRAAIEVLPTAGEALAAMGFAKIPWTMADLAKALHIDEGTARKIAAIWVERQIARRGPDKGLAKGRYQFVEVR